MAAFAHFIQPSDIVIFNDGFQEEFECGTYTDVDSDGNSKISLDTSSSRQIKFSYELGGAYQHAFVGVFLQRKNAELMDWTNIEEMELVLSSKNGKQHLLVIEKLLSDGVSTQPFHYALNVKDGVNAYKIDIDEFRTQAWWFKQNKLSEDPSKKWKKDSISSFNFESCRILSPHLEDVVKLKSIELKAKAYWWPVFSIFGYVLFELLFLVYRMAINKRGEISDDPLKSSSHPYVYYVENQYSDNNLSIELTAQHFDVDDLEINKVVTSETGMDFRTFLSRVRIEAAKKMLIETDEKAYEIARQCGFNNSSGFTQTFKAITGDTPNKYRKKHQK